MGLTQLRVVWVMGKLFKEKLSVFEATNKQNVVSMLRTIGDTRPFPICLHVVHMNNTFIVLAKTAHPGFIIHLL